VDLACAREGVFSLFARFVLGRGLECWVLEEEGKDKDRSSEVFVVRVIGSGDRERDIGGSEVVFEFFGVWDGEFSGVWSDFSSVVVSEEFVLLDELL